MTITDFTHDYIEQALKMIEINYEAERGHVPALPPAVALPDLAGFAENGLGVAALASGRVLGFLCCYPPHEDSFRSTGVRGVFSPMHGNGTVAENRERIYARLYQAAAEKWVGVGAVSHGICLYAHDEAAQRQFFNYGFGLRCIDAIRGMDEMTVPSCDGYAFSELAPKEVLEILPLENMLDESYIHSPFFMFRAKENEAAFLKKYEHFQSVYFIAKHKGRIVAFVRAELDGENFICGTPGYLHVKGAYCLPEHRGKGLNQMLLSMLVQKLKTKGYTRLGVDFESFNPTGRGFWLKHFNAYTHSVVRRIDEKALAKPIQERQA